MVSAPPALAQGLQAAGYTVAGDKFPTGRPDRATFLVTTAEGKQLVARTSSPEVANRTFANMRALWQSPFGAARQPPGMPQPLEVLPDLGVLLMEHLPGRPLADMGPAQERHFDSAIKLLAELHSSGVTPETKRSSRGVVRSAQRKAAHAGQLAPPHAAALNSLAAALETQRVGDSELVPTHGDFSPRNVLAGGERLALIDWERFQLADPARDVAYFASWGWLDVLRRGRMPGGSSIKHAVEVYETARPGAKLRKRMKFHVAASLMRRACSLIELWPEQSYLVPAIVRVALRELE